ncbi:29494_t:CDS:2, partial [Racocetra persica]
TALDKKATSILSVPAPVKKSYESIIRRYEALAMENKWLNQDGSTTQEIVMIGRTYELTHLLFWAVALTAFYGLARLGELLPNNQDDESRVSALRALGFETTG